MGTSLTGKYRWAGFLKKFPNQYTYIVYIISYKYDKMFSKTVGGKCMLEEVGGYLYGEEDCIICKTKMLWYCKIQKDMPDVADRIKAKIMPVKISEKSPKISASIFFECPKCEAITKLNVKF